MPPVDTKVERSTSVSGDGPSVDRSQNFSRSESSHFLRDTGRGTVPRGRMVDIAGMRKRAEEASSRAEADFYDPFSSNLARETRRSEARTAVAPTLEEIRALGLNWFQKSLLDKLSALDADAKKGARLAGFISRYVEDPGLTPNQKGMAIEDCLLANVPEGGKLAPESPVACIALELLQKSGRFDFSKVVKDVFGDQVPDVVRLNMDPGNRERILAAATARQKALELKPGFAGVEARVMSDLLALAASPEGKAAFLSRLGSYSETELDLVRAEYWKCHVQDFDKQVKRVFEGSPMKVCVDAMLAGHKREGELKYLLENKENFPASNGHLLSLLYRADRVQLAKALDTLGTDLASVSERLCKGFPDKKSQVLGFTNALISAGSEVKEQQTEALLAGLIGSNKVEDRTAAIEFIREGADYFTARQKDSIRQIVDASKAPDPDKNLIKLALSADPFAADKCALLAIQREPNSAQQTVLCAELRGRLSYKIEPEEIKQLQELGSKSFESLDWLREEMEQLTAGNVVPARASRIRSVIERFNKGNIDYPELERVMRNVLQDSSNAAEIVAATNLTINLPRLNKAERSGRIASLTQTGKLTDADRIMLSVSRNDKEALLRVLQEVSAPQEGENKDAQQKLRELDSALEKAYKKKLQVVCDPLLEGEARTEFDKMMAPDPAVPATQPAAL